MELGSEYNLSLGSLSKTENNLFSYLDVYRKIIFFDSGRSAIRYFASNLHIGDEVLLPEVICESVIHCFSADDIVFYKIKEDFTIDVDDLQKKINSRTRVLFLMHYFGAIQPEEVQNQIRNIASENKLIILEDATHSMFSCIHTIGDYVTASIRKWLPIPRGGLLLKINDKLHLKPQMLMKDTDNSKVYGMILKDLFLKGKLDCNPTYRKIFKETEESLDNQSEIYEISDFSKYILSCIDIDKLIRKRKHNYLFLKTRLASQSIIPAIGMKTEWCPLVLPIRVQKRDEFRTYLMDNQIYCAVHWPFDGIRESERIQAVKNSQELISFPVDQRYDEEHMDFIAETISKYGGDYNFKYI